MSLESIRVMAQSARRAGLLLSAVTLQRRNEALLAIAQALNAHRAEIFEANELDLQAAAEEKLSAPLLARLRFDEAKIQSEVDIG